MKQAGCQSALPASPSDADYVLAKVQFGAGVSRVVECPKGMVGRVIGKGGETIKALQRTYQVGAFGVLRAPARQVDPGSL